jgi:hypothetical protein
MAEEEEVPAAWELANGNCSINKSRERRGLLCRGF